MSHINTLGQETLQDICYVSRWRVRSSCYKEGALGFLVCSLMEGGLLMFVFLLGVAGFIDASGCLYDWQDRLNDC